MGKLARREISKVKKSLRKIKEAESAYLRSGYFVPFYARKAPFLTTAAPLISTLSSHVSRIESKDKVKATEAAWNAQKIIPEVENALDRDVFTINFSELEGEERKHGKIQRFLRAAKRMVAVIVGVATAGLGFSLEDSKLIMVGVVLSTFGLAAEMVVDNIRKFYEPPDTKGIRGAIEIMRESLKELEQNLRELLSKPQFFQDSIEQGV